MSTKKRMLSPPVDPARLARSSMTLASSPLVAATSGPVAIRSGLEALQQGGTAADAVTTTALAQIRLSFVHGGDRAEPCRRRTREELEKLAPNMRKPLECSRRRLPSSRPTSRTTTRR